MEEETNQEMSLEDKQEYLRNEIIDKHFKAEEFVSFFQERKGDNFDEALSLITFDDLKQVHLYI